MYHPLSKILQKNLILFVDIDQNKYSGNGCLMFQGPHFPFYWNISDLLLIWKLKKENQKSWVSFFIEMIIWVICMRYRTTLLFMPSFISNSNLSSLCFDLTHLNSFLEKIKVINSCKSQQKLIKSISFW